jgi:tripartite-type tricarboxylate transporter receptor subunit TctC
LAYRNRHSFAPSGFDLPPLTAMTPRGIKLMIAAVLLGGAGTPYAQPAFPNKPLRMIVAFPAGGPTDLQARLIARKLSDALAQPVVVDNRGGAGGVIGAELAAKAPPDGHTMFFASISVVMAPLLMQKPPVDAVRDFAPIGMVSTNPYVMLVHPSLPVKTLRDFVALAKARAGQLNYSSSGTGTPPHLGVELMKLAAGISITHIPHKGAGPALTDLLAGHVAMAWMNPLTALPQHRSGKARALAVTTLRRSPAAPEIPTLAEGGVSGVDVGSWFAMLAPAGTAKDITARLYGEVTRAVSAPDSRARLDADGSEPFNMPPDETAVFMRYEMVKWQKVVKAINIRSD